MTSFATVGEFDLRVPITFVESGQTLGEASKPLQLFVYSMTTNNYRERKWTIDIDALDALTIDRAEELHASSFYGALPLRFTPPGESETNVFMDMPSGISTTRTSNRRSNIRITLTESK